MSRVVASMLAIPVLACGIKLAPLALDRPLPSELKARVVLRGVLVGPNTLDGYVGYIMDVKGTETGSACRPISDTSWSLSYDGYLKPGTAPSTRPITHVWYEAKVTRGASTQGSFLAFAESLSSESAAEVIIEEIALQRADSFRIAELDSIADLGLPDGVCGRYIIVAAMLSSVKSRTFHKISGRTAVGTAFGASGGAFASTSQFASELVFSVDARPLRALTRPTGIGVAPGGQVSPPPSELRVSPAGPARARIR